MHCRTTSCALSAIFSYGTCATAWWTATKMNMDGGQTWGWYCSPHRCQTNRIGCSIVEHENGTWREKWNWFICFWQIPNEFSRLGKFSSPKRNEIGRFFKATSLDWWMRGAWDTMSRLSNCVFCLLLHGIETCSNNPLGYFVSGDDCVRVCAL